MNIDVTVLSDEQLVVELTTWVGRVAAGEAYVLQLLGELDARESWAAQGALSSAHWASWRLGLTLATAREKVRVARVLRELPLLAEQLAAGRVSYAQARAITRVATAADEARWVELARYTTASQLERAVRGVNRARQDPATAAEPARDEVRVSWEEDGTLVLTTRISAAHAPAVLARLEQARNAEQADRDAQLAQLARELAGRGASAEAPGGDVPGETADADVSAEAPAAPEGAPPYAEPYEYVEPPYPMPRQRVSLFDQRSPAELAAIAAWEVERDRRRALRDAARAWEDHVAQQAAAQELPTGRATLADGLIRALTRPDSLKPSTVTLLLDPLSGWARTPSGELLPPSTLRQILKTLPGRAKLRPRKGLTQHDLGRRSRLVSPALRELLGQLDGERCRFPSCDRTRNLHAHHVVFWSHGGPTDLANLALVCSRHHTLIHTQGVQLVLSPDRTLTVRTADDIPVPHHPTRPAGNPAELDQTANAFTSDWNNDPFDLGYVVHVMTQQSS